MELFVNGISVVSTSSAVGDIFVSTEAVKLGVIGIGNVDSYHFNGGMTLWEMGNRNWTAEEELSSFNQEKAYFGLGGSTQKITINPASSAKISVS